MINVKRTGLNVTLRSGAQVIAPRDTLDPAKNGLLFDTKVFVAKRREAVKVEAECDKMWALHNWKTTGERPIPYNTYIYGHLTLT